MNRQAVGAFVGLLSALLLLTHAAAQDRAQFVDPVAGELFRYSRQAVGVEAVSKLTSLILNGRSRFVGNDGALVRGIVEIKLLLPDHYLRIDRVGDTEKIAGYAGTTVLSAIRSNGNVSLRDIARAYYLAPNDLPGDTDAHGLEVTGGFSPTRITGIHTGAAHATVVAVDPETGGVEILDYVVVEDAGTLVNPMIVDGQIFGGTAQGIGSALFEEMAFDKQGQPLASTLADYLLPGSTDVPNIRVLHMQTPSPYTEFGIKGVGEGGAIGPGAAIANAVNDALKSYHVEICEIPITPRKILNALSTQARR